MHTAFPLACLLATLWLGDTALAAPPVQAKPGASGNPLNSPIRRINPNSRQGTVPSSPAQRDGWQRSPPTPLPTLENRGIGNGQAFPRPAPAVERSP